MSLTRIESASASSTLGRRRRWPAVVLWMLAIGGALLAILGPLGLDVIRYHVSATAANQIVGGDVAGLFLMAPVSAIAAILVWNGHRAGPFMALGPAFYGLYMYFQLALGGDVVRYEGNSERFFVLYLGLFLLSGVVAIWAWTTVSARPVPTARPAVERALGWFSLVVAVFLAIGLHLPGLVDAWRDEPASVEYLADPTVFWLVKMMDLGLVVPALLALGIGTLTGARWALTMRFAGAGWIALLGSSVAGMAITMQATGDPAATTANTVAFSLFALVGLGLATATYQRLFRPADSVEETLGG